MITFDDEILNDLSDEAKLCLSNQSFSEDRIKGNISLLKLTMDELADTVLMQSAFSNVEDLMDFLAAVRTDQPQAEDIPSSDLSDPVSSLTVDTLSKTFFSESIVNRIKTLKDLTVSDIVGSSPAIPINGKNKTVCFQSPLSDRALSSFIKEGFLLESSGCSGAEDVCEEISNGLCEYCILPLYDSGNGHLFHFLELIETYELKIVSTCRIESSEGQYVQFGLLAQVLPERFPASRCALAFLIPGNQASAIAQIMAAAYCEKCDLVSTWPSCRQKGVCFTLSSTQDRLMVMLMHLRLFYPQFTPLGIYRYVPMQESQGEL